MARYHQVYKCGNQLLTRTVVPDEKRDWNIAWSDYKPCLARFDFGNKPWADPDLSAPGFKPKWNAQDGAVNRASHCGSYGLDAQGYPLNVAGRTGVALRGVLGRWGPNHAVDPIVTRWLRDENNQMVLHNQTKRPILQFVSILRDDVKQWAIPGGMVDPGETVLATLVREFSEECFNTLQGSKQDRETINQKVSSFFKMEKGNVVYKGYVDDPRNTDNAWIETVAVNFHDEHGDTLSGLSLRAGDDAAEVRWTDINHTVALYANHQLFISNVVHSKHAHW